MPAHFYKYVCITIWEVRIFLALARTHANPSTLLDICKLEAVGNWSSTCWEYPTRAPAAAENTIQFQSWKIITRADRVGTRAAHTADPIQQLRHTGVVSSCMLFIAQSNTRRFGGRICSRKSYSWLKDFPVLCETERFITLLSRAHRYIFTSTPWFPEWVPHSRFDKNVYFHNF